jgi:cysteine sulfinate desulfinase/cysteine desulfurase-like protein
VPLIVGMGKAAELAREHLPDHERKGCALRGVLAEGVSGLAPVARLAGPWGSELRLQLTAVRGSMRG